MADDPYSLREIGLDRPQVPAEAGRTLYHLAQHRGFWSAQVDRPKTKEEEKEAGVVKEAVQELTQDLGEQNPRRLFGPTCRPARPSADAI